MGSTASSFDFERDWPELRARVQRSLAGWRVPAWLEEDILQETAVKIWNLRAQIDPARSVEGLAARIAVNLLKDHLRGERFLVTGADIPIPAGAQDVENEVIARDEWRRVRSALTRLNPARRAALMAAVFGDGSDRTPVALRMMKMRARKQLRVLMEEVGRAKAGCVVLVQRMWDHVTARGFDFRSPSVQHLAQVASAAIVVVTAGALSVPSVDPQLNDGNVAGRAAPDKAHETVATFELRDPPVGREDVSYLAVARRESPERMRPRARTLVRVGPLAYGSGDSAASGTLHVDPIRIVDHHPEIGISTRGLICRVAAVGGCKGRATR